MIFWKDLSNATKISGKWFLITHEQEHLLIHKPKASFLTSWKKTIEGVPKENIFKQNKFNR